MAVARSIIFWALIITCTLLYGILGIFLLPFGNQSFATKICLVWSKVFCKALEVICKVKVELIDEQNVPKQACIVAMKHQSAWETIYFMNYFTSPAFILKKELLKIPIFGWYVRMLKMIAIDRAGGASMLKQMSSAAKEIIKDGRKIVIFPEGTRVRPGQSVNYKSGVVALYKDLEDVTILPVALNSGHAWPGKSLIIQGGTIRVKFLKPISGKMEKKKLLEKLKHEIDSATNSL